MSRFAPQADLQARYVARPEYEEPTIRGYFLTCRSAHMLRGNYNLQLAFSESLTIARCLSSGRLYRPLAPDVSSLYTRVFPCSKMANMLHGLGLRAAKALVSCILQMARYRGAIAYSPTAAHTKLMTIESPQRLRPEGTPPAHPLFSASTRSK